MKRHPALDYSKVGAFVAELREQMGTAAQALELAILTVTRTNDIIKARFDAIDLARKTWTIPRTKNGRPLRVPLSGTGHGNRGAHESGARG